MSKLRLPRAVKRKRDDLVANCWGHRRLKSLSHSAGCWCKVGPRQLHIGIEDDFRPTKKAHAAFAVKGMRRFYASDPWGNRLEFTEPSADLKN